MIKAAAAAFRFELFSEKKAEIDSGRLYVVHSIGIACANVPRDLLTPAGLVRYLRRDYGDAL